VNENFRLLWQQSASRDLLRATSQAEPAIRRIILSSIADVEAILEKEAGTAGESRERGVRFLIYSPLAVSYKVNVRLREVFIFRVRVFRTKH
jgi:hypothetical protein